MKHTVITKIVRVTPDLATQWLEKNTHNRPIKDTAVKDYAADMKAKKWELNGSAIVFDWDGTLQDGQHRLWACIESDTPFMTNVTEGVDPKVFPTIDTGRKRTAADVLGIADVVNRNAVAAAAAIVISYKKGTIKQNERVSHRDVLEFVSANADLGEWVSRCKRAKGFSQSYTTLLAAVLFLGSRKHPQRADDFLHKFQTGEDLKTGSPVLALRNRLLTSKDKRKDRLALIIQAWNAFVKGRPLTKMQLPRSDQFPKIDW